MQIYKQPTFLIAALLFCSFVSRAQLPFNLVDGRQHKFCASCREIIESKPNEVLFGLQINANGEIYFSMNNIEWFNKIFRSNSYGVSADLVSKERYNCNRTSAAASFALPKGTMLEPVYKPDLIKGVNVLSQGTVFVKIGQLSPALMKKELEANLVIVNGNYICFYTNFVNIDRNVWHLLPMGLYTDSLLQEADNSQSKISDQFRFTKKIQLEVPFEKSSASFNRSYMNRLYDSIDLATYSIRKIEVRAYSSVEGPELLNKQLMQRRADTIIQAVKKYDPSMRRISLVIAENWLEFFNDIKGTKQEELQELSKPEIKQKLTDKTVTTALEPILAKHRKAVITMYLETKSAAATISETAILSEFKKAVIEKNIPAARNIQRELVERITDNKLPVEYINAVEVPQSKEFCTLLNDREVYRFLLKTTSEYEALDNFLALKKIDPDNGRISYNICALRFFMWQYGGDSLSQKLLMQAINALPALGINSVLTKRMQINYYILMCEDNFRREEYAAKDSSLVQIRSIYQDITLNDEDIYSLAKYFANYSHHDWAEEIVKPRIDKIDVSENLVFYYLNLQFYYPAKYETDDFQHALLNAINLNNKRFCNFFLPNDRGGASMQLLDYDELKEIYCQECKTK